MKTKHRFIENGPVVVCIATKSFISPLIPEKLTLKVKAIARVNEESGDVYDVEKGRNLSALRAEVKLNEKYNRICKHFSEILKDRMNATYNTQVEAQAKAEKELNDYLATL